VAVETTATSAYSVGNGVTTAFSLPFYFIDPAHIQITLDGALQGGGYNVLGARVPAGGTVTFVVPPALGVIVGRHRVVPITQPVDTQNNQTIFEDVFDDGLDRRCMVEQQLSELGGRAIGAPAGEEALNMTLPSAADRAGKILGFDLSGVPAVSRHLLTEMDALLDDATGVAQAAADAKAALLQIGALLTGILPTVVKSATTASQPGSPVTGDAYIVPNAGWGGLHGNAVAIYTTLWTYYQPGDGLQMWVQDSNSRYKYNGVNSTWKMLKSKLVFQSDFVSVAAALTIAAGATPTTAKTGTRLVIDEDVSLLANTSIPLAVRGLAFQGGRITFGNFDLTGTGQSLDAGIEWIMVQTGTGRLKGHFDHQFFYPEWLGAQPAKYTSADPFGDSTTVTTNGTANSTWTYKALQYAINYISQSEAPNREIVLTNYMYGVAATLTNATAGNMPKIRGSKENSVRIFQSVQQDLFLLTGADSASEGGVFFQDLTLIGLTYDGVHGVGLLHVKQWGGFRTLNVHIGRSTYGLMLDNDTGHFMENAIFENCTFDYDCALPVNYVKGQSFRGTGLAGHTLYSRGDSSGSRLVFFGAGAYSYAIPMGRITYTDFSANPSLGSIFEVETGSSGAWLTDMSLDLESVGQIIRVATGVGLVYGSGTVHEHGGFVVWGSASQGSVLGQFSSITGGLWGQNRLEAVAGYTQVLNSGGNVVARDIGDFRRLRLSLYNGFTYSAALEVSLAKDTIGGQNRIMSQSFQRMYGSSTLDPVVSLDPSTGQLLLSNAAWDGSIRLFGTGDYAS
jgi:hypothetical protein